MIGRRRRTAGRRQVPGLGLALLAALGLVALIAGGEKGSVSGGARAHPARQESATPGAVVDVFPPNVVRFGGVFFVGGGGPGPRGPLPVGRDLAEADLGPEVGRVTSQVQDGRALGACPVANLPDGSASFLPLDTPLYAVKGYATSFRLAARSGGYVLRYEAVCSERARVGADLLDIAGRVERVNVHAADATEVVAFDDPAAIERLVGLVLAAPIDPALLEPDARLLGREFYVIFFLVDGTSSASEIRPYQGDLLLRPGVVLPPELGAMIAEAAGGAFWQGPPTGTPTA